MCGGWWGRCGGVGGGECGVGRDSRHSSPRVTLFETLGKVEKALAGSGGGLSGGTAGPPTVLPSETEHPGRLRIARPCLRLPAKPRIERPRGEASVPEGRRTASEAQGPNRSALEIPIIRLGESVSEVA